MIEEGEEAQVKGTGNFFKKIIEEKFPNLNEAPLKIQEAYRTQNRLVKKKKFPSANSNQSTKCTEQRRILNAARGKGQETYKGRSTRITPDFVVVILKVRKT